MISSVANEDTITNRGVLLCQLFYCRAEARALGLEMVEYFLDMARLEIEALLRAGASDVASGSSNRRRAVKA